MRWACIALLFFAWSCDGKLNDKRFRKKAEEAYMEVNVGWTIVKRSDVETVFVRGDQVDHLPVGQMFAEYEASGKSGGDYFDAWTRVESDKAAQRRRTLEQARQDVIPIIKSGSWVKIQDLGAIGSPRIQRQIRPWRHKIADDTFVVLGVPEEKLGYRLASIAELEESKTKPEEWLKVSVANLERTVGTSTDGGALLTRKDGRWLVFDMPNTDGVSALILSDTFRNNMLESFKLEEIGAAVPNRNVLILFDPADFVSVKPVRARTHQLYDTQNHPGFRGLLRIHKDGLDTLEAANPKRKKLH